ncbi:MAG: NADH-quinone oxidoreductase subunit C [Candidatus Thermoplasmatota archaeon]|nr:NADH-quinone oxidoreductase subunit C [Candidatus Thermoplasmatota archaeon]
MASPEILTSLKGTECLKTAFPGNNSEIYAPVDEAEFPAIIDALANDGCVLISLFCAQNFEGRKGLALFYAFERRGCENILVLMRSAKGSKATSVAQKFPSACWFEREVSDGFGIEFEGAFDNRRLFLHEVYPEDFHPLLKETPNKKIKLREKIPAESEYQFKPMNGEGVYQIPVGPVHAGIIEPGHFRFSVIGEPISNLEVRMFYKHRGVEKLAEGKTPEECVKIAEAISGDETVANSVAFCMAVEKISGAKIPARADRLRAVLLEMERIYSLLGDVAGMAVDIAFASGASPFFILREEILRQNANLTGSRFMKGIVGIGGLKKDVPENELRNLSSYLKTFPKLFKEAHDSVLSSTISVDRFDRTGLVEKRLVSPLNLTGPIARASGVQIDNRKDRPYGAYQSFKPRVKIMDGGDVLSRFEVKSHEILESVNLIQKILKDLPEGPVSSNFKISDGFCLSTVEAPRGQNLHWVYIKDGVVDRYKVRTASFCNWQAIEHAVIGNIVPDFPLINKSMNLSYAGTDL